VVVPVVAGSRVVVASVVSLSLSVGWIGPVVPVVPVVVPESDSLPAVGSPVVASEAEPVGSLVVPVPVEAAALVLPSVAPALPLPSPPQADRHSGAIITHEIRADMEISSA
jgi:hypothetical protein